MDPVALFLFIMMGLLLLGTVCKVIIWLTEPGLVPLDYNERWGNKEYVAMIHGTRALELENMGEVITVCECPVHAVKVLQPEETLKPTPLTFFCPFGCSGEKDTHH